MPTSSVPADSPPPMSASEAETIWMSSSAMKKPTHMLAKANTFVAIGSSPGAAQTFAVVVLIARRRRR